MAKLIGFRGLLCTTIAVVWALGGRASPAESLRLVTQTSFVPSAVADDKARGFAVEVLKQVFAAIGQDASFDSLPVKRSWSTIASGERDGIFSVSRTSERERFCSFPDEPLRQERWVFFIRTADVGKLKFSSFDDLVGHDVAVYGTVAGLIEQPMVSPELWKFLREHHNMIETPSPVYSLRILAAGRVDYAVIAYTTAMRDITALGLSGKIEPLLSRSVIEGGLYICFNKAHVSPSFVEAFSRALRQFKQTEAFQTIYHKYFP